MDSKPHRFLSLAPTRRSPRCDGAQAGQRLRRRGSEPRQPRTHADPSPPRRSSRRLGHRRPRTHPPARDAPAIRIAMIASSCTLLAGALGEEPLPRERAHHRAGRRTVAITNIDDIVILALFFAQGAGHRNRLRRIFLPQRVIPYLGLLPLVALKAAWQAMARPRQRRERRYRADQGRRFQGVGGCRSHLCQRLRQHRRLLENGQCSCLHDSVAQFGGSCGECQVEAREV